LNIVGLFSIAFFRAESFIQQHMFFHANPSWK